MKNLEQQRPLFIIGCYRSGTTLLRRILNTHPNIYIAKETQFLINISHCPTTIHKEYTKKEIENLFKYAKKFLKRNGWEKLPNVEDFLKTGERPTLSNLFKFICLLEKPNKKKIFYWGDNTPRYVFIGASLFDLYSNIRFIHIVRDPRDVFSSSKISNIGGYTAFTVALDWVQRIGAAFCLEKIVGTSQFLTIRFEELVLNPERTLEKVSKFLGIENKFHPNVIDIETESIAKRFPHHRKLVRPLDKSEIGIHIKTLTLKERKIIESITFNFLRFFGYSIECYNYSFAIKKFHNLAIEYLINSLLNLKRKFIYFLK